MQYSDDNFGRLQQEMDRVIKDLHKRSSKIRRIKESVQANKRGKDDKGGFEKTFEVDESHEGEDGAEREEEKS